MCSLINSSHQHLLCGHFFPTLYVSTIHELCSGNIFIQYGQCMHTTPTSSVLTARDADCVVMVSQWHTVCVLEQ